MCIPLNIMIYLWDTVYFNDFDSERKGNSFSERNLKVNGIVLKE